jgi:diketogulonate reductase-like aldo/keto reductase
MLATAVRAIELPSGDTMPALGQGTWHLGEDSRRRKDELAALRLGIDLGMSLIDTAEMYADGGAEKLVGEAIAGRRDEVFLVSKVLPSHATYDGTISACEHSLRRLKTNRLDLYLLHWRGEIPLRETISAFEELERTDKIRNWGVSNFDEPDMRELVSLPGGERVAANQVLYNLSRRGIEWDLLPWCTKHRVPIMAYSPIEQGRLLGNPTLRRVAERHNTTEAQVALAWVLRHPDVSAIPRSGSPEHVRENREALDTRLTPADLGALDEAFPPPSHKVPLEVL